MADFPSKYATDSGVNGECQCNWTCCSTDAHADICSFAQALWPFCWPTCRS